MGGGSNNDDDDGSIAPVFIAGWIVGLVIITRIGWEPTVVVAVWSFAVLLSGLWAAATLEENRKKKDGTTR